MNPVVVASSMTWSRSTAPTRRPPQPQQPNPARDLVRLLEDTARWASEPLREGERLLAELGSLASELSLSLAQMRAIVAAAMGEGDHRTHADLLAERRPAVAALVRRLREVARDLAGIRSRARLASRRALLLALEAPRTSEQMLRQLRCVPPSAARDLATVEALTLPAHTKRRAEEIRNEAALLPAQAAALQHRLTDGPPGCPMRHGSRVATMKIETSDDELPRDPDAAAGHG